MEWQAENINISQFRHDYTVDTIKVIRNLQSSRNGMNIDIVSKDENTLRYVIVVSELKLISCFKI